MSEPALKTVPKPDLAAQKLEIDTLSDGICKLKEHREGLLKKQSTAQDRLKQAALETAEKVAQAIIDGNSTVVSELQSATSEAQQAEQAVARELQSCDIGIRQRQESVGTLKHDYRLAYKQQTAALTTGKMDKARDAFKKATVEYCAYQTIHHGVIYQPETALREIRGDALSELNSKIDHRMRELTKSVGEKL